jgi:hypothetical protein
MDYRKRTNGESTRNAPNRDERSIQATWMPKRSRFWPIWEGMSTNVIIDQFPANVSPDVPGRLPGS